MDIIYFSYTGNCQKIAHFLAKKLGLLSKEIQAPRLPYFLWLILSFIPNLPFKVEIPSLKDQNLVLVFPKWTFNCPPITFFHYYCVRNGIKFSKIFLIISYGGFGEKKYAQKYAQKFQKISQEVKVFLLKKENINEKLPELYQWIKDSLC